MDIRCLPAGANGQAGAGTGTGAPAEADTVPFRLVFATTLTLAVDTPVQLDIDAEERTEPVEEGLHELSRIAGGTWRGGSGHASS